jgi:uncharacterized membrane protein
MLIIPIVTLLMWAAIGLDIFIFRQIVIFVYLSFIPGLVLFKILRLKETTIVDTILFSVGLSIAFLMFFGLAINDLFPMLGISKPLSTIPLAITLSLLMLILFIIDYKRDLSEHSNTSDRTFVDLGDLIKKSTILILPAIGIIGALYLNVPLLALMIIAIAALYVLSVFSTRSIPIKLYPLVIFAVSLALAVQVLLTSKYIIGYDSQLEYYVFRLTAINEYWRVLLVGINPGVTADYSSMLSITILPTIYSALMDIGGEIVFKSFYPFVFSLVPVTLFRIYEGRIGKSGSLLSVLFFISGVEVFYGLQPLSLDRQIVGEFFLVLSILILLNKKIPVGKRRLLLVVFGAALVVSHYSLMYLYLFYVLSIYALSKIKGRRDEVLDGKMVLFLHTIAFSWYSFSISPVTSFSQFLFTVFSRFSSDIFQTAARSSFVFGSHPAFGSMTNLAGAINWASFFAAHFLIAVGIVILLFRPGKTQLDPKFRILSILSGVILFLCFVVPNIAPSLNLTRFYAITLLFLAPCIVLVGETILGISESMLKKARSRRSFRKTHSGIKSVLLCTVIVGYFLSQSGFVNLVTGAFPLSYSLDLNRIRTSNDRNLEINFHSVYIQEQDVFGAVWLSRNMKASSTIYADGISGSNVLISYGLIPKQQITFLTNSTVLAQGGFVYLGSLNVVDGVIPTDTEPFNSSRILPVLNENDLIYSNGNTEIWRVSSPSYFDHGSENP